MKNVAFVGLGNMGFPMASRLVKAGYQVYGVDISPERLTRFAEIGGHACRQVSEACRHADTLITMLPRDGHVRDTLFGELGAARVLGSNALVIDMSTIHPATSADLSRQLQDKGIRFLDAPVGRTPADAADGKLLVMVGGAAADVTEAQPIFDCFANKIIHMGGVGAGATMKVINNYMSMVSMVMTAETLAMASQAGIELDTATEVLQNTVAGKGQINTNYPRKVLAGDLTPDFPIALGLKDLSLALNLAGDINAPTILGVNAAQIFSLAINQGREQQDCTAILLALQELAGIKRDLT